MSQNKIIKQKNYSVSRETSDDDICVITLTVVSLLESILRKKPKIITPYIKYNYYNYYIVAHRNIRIPLKNHRLTSPSKSNNFCFKQFSEIILFLRYLYAFFFFINDTLLKNYNYYVIIIFFFKENYRIICTVYSNDFLKFSKLQQCIMIISSFSR